MAEKYEFGRPRQTSFLSWLSLVPYPIAIPSVRRRVVVPLPLFLHPSSQPVYLGGNSPHATPASPSSFLLRRKFRRAYLNSPRTVLLTIISLIALFLVFVRSFSSAGSFSHLPFQGPPDTNVLTPDLLSSLWKYEILSGHYPSRRPIPAAVSLPADTLNPALPAQGKGTPIGTSTAMRVIPPSGPAREYLDIPSVPPYLPNSSSSSLNNNDNDDLPPPSAFPPRPVQHSILDLDLVMQYCDFSTNQYVRDCLQVLRTASHLDNHKRFRRARLDPWRVNYLDDSSHPHLLDQAQDPIPDTIPPDVLRALGYKDRPVGQHSPPSTSSSSPLQDDPLLADAVGPTQAPDDNNLYDGPDSSSSSSPQFLPNPQRSLRRVGNHPHPTHPTADPQCSPDYPRLFHIFWAGPFTEKPYLALLSFLFTQNIGLQHPMHATNPQDEEARNNFMNSVCRPQLWVWINPGPAASIPNPNARRDMLDTLNDNPWSAPFLHPRFSEVIQFKLWNTTEQLDGIPELRDEWRHLPLFNSGGVKYETPTKNDNSNDNPDEDELEEEEGLNDEAAAAAGDESLREGVDSADFAEGAAGDSNSPQAAGAGAGVAADSNGAAVDGSSTNNSPDSSGTSSSAKTKHKKKKKGKNSRTEDELAQRVGSTSAQGYDRLSVVLSDMARFVLTHRFGGVYLDADTIFLRDWEELWGWKGAFAYRWSRLEKYNTAVLKMHRNSALGSFIFKTALANGLDFHPMTISRYTKDAKIDDLLLRLPDALFDPAWLNTEYYQRDRPAYPYFKRFEEFFETPNEDNAAPAIVGFEGFFRGAFSYHYHNFWWVSFDPARDWPDLGPRFEAGERKARVAAMKKKLAAAAGTDENSASAAAASTSSAASSSSKKLASNAGVLGDDEDIDEVQDVMKDREVEIDEDSIVLDQDSLEDDVDDLSWATVLKRTFESYIRGERPNMYGEYINWN